MENMTYYNKFRVVPQEAQKPIGGGRLKGMTDINPMWRIKLLTEAFGVCGIGWKYVITEKRLEKSDHGEVAAFVDIDLFIKVDSEWSCAIPGTGGSSFIANEKNGLYLSDECFKMALTDALSVACKALGIGADIYFSKDRTKYDAQQEKPAEKPKQSATEKIDKAKQNVLTKKAGNRLKGLLDHYKVDLISDLTVSDFFKAMKQLDKPIEKVTPDDGDMFDGQHS